MPFATINGIRINYLVQGKGPPLLMFAPGGWRSVISRWTAAGGKEAFGQMDGLTTLSLDFTCIAYDRRECGLSGGRVEPLAWDLYVEEAKGLLDLAGAKQAFILGSCMGAPQKRSEEHTSELQSLAYLVCRLLLEKKKKKDACSITF